MPSFNFLTNFIFYCDYPLTKILFSIITFTQRQLMSTFTFEIDPEIIRKRLEQWLTPIERFDTNNLDITNGEFEEIQPKDIQ